MMDEISVDTPFDFPEKHFYSSKLRLIVSKGGTKSANLYALSFYF